VCRKLVYLLEIKAEIESDWENLASRWFGGVAVMETAPELMNVTWSNSDWHRNTI
jgi:hypothetical protein